MSDTTRRPSSADGADVTVAPSFMKQISNEAKDDDDYSSESTDREQPGTRQHEGLKELGMELTHQSGSNADSNLHHMATPQRQPSIAKTLSRVPTAETEPEFSQVREIAFISIICAAQLLTQSGLAQSIAPLHIIGDSFDVSNPGQLSWLPAAYSLTVGTFILPAGRWGDLYGHKNLFVVGYIWFAVWSVVAGFTVWSHNFIFFAFCRAMQGIGPAILLPNGIAILARTYPPGPKKEMVLAFFGAAAPSGFLLGAVFSGIFAQLLWWPWAYWVSGVVLFVIAGLTVIVVPACPVHGTRPTLQELDYLGTILGVLGLVMFNFAWNEGPAAGWGRPYVYVLLIVSVAVLAAFLYVEAKVSAHPLLPVEAFTRDTSLVFGCIAAGWASFGIWVYYFWQFMEVVLQNSVLLTAAKISPIAVSGATAAIVTGVVIGKVQPGWIMLISMTAFCTGTILLATNSPDRVYWAQIFVSSVITPWGMDMSFPSGVIVLSNHMSPEQQGVAASLVNTVVNYSISIGLGIAGTVETQVNDDGANVLAGYRGAWYTGIGLSGLGIVLAVCLTFSWRMTVKEKERASLEKDRV